MFGLFHKSKDGAKAAFHIDGMHCVSCCMNVDGALEDSEGVYESKTHYAKETTIVLYDPKKTDIQTLKKIIESVGYKAIHSTVA